MSIFLMYNIQVELFIYIFPAIHNSYFLIYVCISYEQIVSDLLHFIVKFCHIHDIII